MDKNFYENVLKIALLAFEQEGYANFSIKLLTKCGIGEKKIQSILKDLELKGDISNKTVNGYYSKYKLNYSGKCPDYLYDDRFTFGIKNFILRLSSIWKPGDPILTGKRVSNILSGVDIDRGSTNTASNNMTKIKNITGNTVFDLLESSKYIKYSLDDFIDNIICDENGYKKVVAKKDQDYCCQYCGETNPSEFYNSHITCKKCHNKRQSENRRKDIYKFLYAKALDGYDARQYIKGFDITVEDIKAQWQKQNYKDYYTGLELEDLSKLSIDRLDSSKGYTPDNIVLTDYRINVMKNYMTIE